MERGSGKGQTKAKRRWGRKGREDSKEERKNRRGERWKIDKEEKMRDYKNEKWEVNEEGERKKTEQQTRLKKMWKNYWEKEIIKPKESSLTIMKLENWLKEPYIWVWMLQITVNSNIFHFMIGKLLQFDNTL